MLVMKKKKTDSLLKGVGSDAAYKFIRSAPLLMTKLEDYTDAIGLVDVFEVRMVGLTYLFKASSSASKRRWLAKTEDIQKRLRDQQTNRYTLIAEQ